MDKRILVVGGQGNVGSQITEYLIKEYNLAVDVTSRSGVLNSEALLALEKKPGVVRLNLSAAEDYQMLENYTSVIMCVDNENEDFFNECLQRNLLYIDITANMEIISRLRTVYQRTSSFSTIVFGAGLSPGFTNLLADHALKSIDTPESCYISMIFGTGDEHGSSAIKWLVDQITKEYAVRSEGDQIITKPFARAKSIKLLSQNVSRKVYNFNFCDQNIVDELHNLKSVSTGVAYESLLMTRFMNKLTQLGVFKLLKLNIIRRLFMYCIKKINFGSKEVIIQIEASGKKSFRNITKRVEVVGTDESLLTARITSELFVKVSELEIPGFHYMSELFDLEDFKGLLNEKFEYYDNTEVMR